MRLPSDACHSPDFSSAVWNGVYYTFTPTQAAMFRELWNAFESGLPEVHAAALIEAAGSRSQRNALGPLFSRNSAWKTLVVRCKRRGYYRLNLDAPKEP